MAFDGIAGESVDSRHKGEIQLLSFSWGEQNTGAHAIGTGAGTGKVSMQDFQFASNLGISSPKLFLACASGQQISSATLTARKAGAGRESFAIDYLKVVMSEVIVSSYSVAGETGQEVPTNEFTLNFAKIEVDYTPVNANGSPGLTISAARNLLGNKKA